MKDAPNVLDLASSTALHVSQSFSTLQRILHAKPYYAEMATELKSLVSIAMMVITMMAMDAIRIVAWKQVINAMMGHRAILTHAYVVPAMQLSNFHRSGLS
jgi:hypothetical protein